MSPAWIRPRGVKVSARNPNGRTFQVLYRRGGRGYKIETGGTFKTQTEAKARRDLIAGWLARGADPRIELAKLQTPAVAARTYEQWAHAYTASRVDVTAKHARNIASHLARLNPIFGTSDPHKQTVADQIEAVAMLAADLKPSSVERYWVTHRLILDFAGVDPNPARDDKVKLPSVDTPEVVPPSADHFLALLEHAPRPRRLPLVVIEQTGMAIGELHALEWGDVDVRDSRFRLRRETVKARIRARARWVQVPEWLMRLILDTCPPDDRTTSRRVFPGFTPDAATGMMARACKAAGIPLYSPHDLRHRRLSLWHGQGVPARELATRSGHTKPSITLDVYSHVMPLDEVPESSYRALLVVTG